MRWMLQTDDSWTGLILRVTLGLVMFPHGAQKMLGWFGGYGFGGTMSFFTAQLALPWIIGFLVIMGEFFGSLGLLAGFADALQRSQLIIIMLGAITMAHWPYGFFMNWFGQQHGEGFEYHLLVMGIALALIAAGGGKWSLDRQVAHRL